MTENRAPVLRFAPSPTGYLHIGGARPALFNWLYARHPGGKFLLRIEETGRERATIDAGWGIVDGRWRDRQPGPQQEGMPFVIRLKAPQTGETVIEDKVLGTVRWANDQLDDMVLLRSDGTPTYMLAVVVDDYDMGVTHVLRGADHLNNAARQLQIIEALGWPAPVYAHVPLIHGPDGSKLSKRHGALAVEAYRDMGYLPEAMRNYLLRLSWSHGDDEIIPTEKAIEWFDFNGIGRSAARFDMKKLDSLNAHYMREMSDASLADEAIAFAQRKSPGRRFKPEARA